MNTEQTQTATVEANESQQTGHTPGPWEIHRWCRSSEKGLISHGLKNGIWEFSGEGCDDRFTITASTKHLPTSRTYGDFTGCIVAQAEIAYEGESEAEANARLIAAAPELLEACKVVIEDIKNTQSDVELADALGIIEAAISKAEGKTNE